MASAAIPHRGCGRSPIRQLRSLRRHPQRCADLRCAVRICLATAPATVLPTLCISSSTGPSASMGTTLERVQPLTKGRPPSATPLGASPGQTRRTERPTEVATPPTGATGCRRIPCMAKRPPRMTATPGAMPHSARQQSTATATANCSPRFGKRSMTSVVTPCM